MPFLPTQFRDDFALAVARRKIFKSFIIPYDNEFDFSEIFVDEKLLNSVIFAFFVFQEIKNGQGKMEKLKITGKLIRKISQIKC